MAGEATRSALPLAVCLFFNGKFSYIFFLIEFVLMIYKGVRYEYPQQVYAWEIVFIVLYLPIEIPRVLVGTKGVRVEQGTPIIISTIMAVIVAVLHVYYLYVQTYVLMVEVVLNSIALALIVLCIIFGVVAVVAFSKPGNV